MFYTGRPRERSIHWYLYLSMKEFSFYNWTTGGKPEQIQGLFLWWIVNKKREIIKCKTDTPDPFVIQESSSHVREQMIKHSQIWFTNKWNKTLTQLMHGLGSEDSWSQFLHRAGKWWSRSARPRQWQYASNIDEYNCHEDNWLSVELFNNVFSKSISVTVDILFHFYLYSPACCKI